MDTSESEPKFIITPVIWVVLPEGTSDSIVARIVSNIISFCGVMDLHPAVFVDEQAQPVKEADDEP